MGEWAVNTPGQKVGGGLELKGCCSGDGCRINGKHLFCFDRVFWTNRGSRFAGKCRIWSAAWNKQPAAPHVPTEPGPFLSPQLEVAGGARVMTEGCWRWRRRRNQCKQNSSGVGWSLRSTLMWMSAQKNNLITDGMKLSSFSECEQTCAQASVHPKWWINYV